MEQVVAPGRIISRRAALAFTRNRDRAAGHLFPASSTSSIVGFVGR